MEWTGQLYADRPAVAVQTYIEAPPERVWALVSDIYLMPRLSAELREVEWLDGAGEPVPDALIETWQAAPDGSFAHPDDPRGPGAAGPKRLPVNSLGFGIRLTGYGCSSATNRRKTEARADRNQ